jgi:hypothetical protein
MNNSSINDASSSNRTDASALVAIHDISSCTSNESIANNGIVVNGFGKRLNVSSPQEAMILLWKNTAVSNLASERINRTFENTEARDRGNAPTRNETIPSQLIVGRNIHEIADSFIAQYSIEPILKIESNEMLKIMPTAVQLSYFLRDVDNDWVQRVAKSVAISDFGLHRGAAHISNSVVVEMCREKRKDCLDIMQRSCLSLEC